MTNFQHTASDALEGKAAKREGPSSSAKKYETRQQENVENCSSPNFGMICVFLPGVQTLHMPRRILKGDILCSKCKTNEGLCLTKDQWDLDLGQIEEVLGDVDGQLVQEGRGDVEAILDVVQVLGG